MNDVTHICGKDVIRSGPEHPLGEYMYGKGNKVSTLHMGCPELEECDGIGDGDSDGDGDDERAPH